jgi:hypothetical protein
VEEVVGEIDGARSRDHSEFGNPGKGKLPPLEAATKHGSNDRDSKC